MSEHADEALGILSVASDLFEGETAVDGFSELAQRIPREMDAVEKIVANDALDEPAKIDAIAEVRHWFHGDTTIVDAYLAGELSIEATVAKLADPIDEAYTTANHKRQYYESEMTARHQRQFWSAEEALVNWGPEEDVTEPSPETKELPTTEGQLWELWYSILHAAKRIPWTNTAGQEKLLDLVKALKSRPDPPPPSPMPVALKSDWIWSLGVLWSSLLMLGPSARETWNDGCGCGAGWTLPEQHAWINVNAFVARLTTSETSDFSLYGLWALRDALEDKYDARGQHQTTTVPIMRELLLTVAAVWIDVAGRWMYERRITGEHDDVAGPDLDLSLREKTLPWYGEEGVSTSRWRFWKRRLEQEVGDGGMSPESGELVSRATSLISSFEDAA